VGVGLAAALALQFSGKVGLANRATPSPSRAQPLVAAPPTTRPQVALAAIPEPVAQAPAPPSEAPPPAAAPRPEAAAEPEPEAEAEAQPAPPRRAHPKRVDRKRDLDRDRQRRKAVGSRHTKKIAQRDVAPNRHIVDAPPPPDPREAYERGNNLLFAGDVAGATAAYREAVRFAPSDPIGYRGLGLALEQQGDTAGAVRALRRYLKLAPGARDRELIARRIGLLGHTGAHK
jgi:tetratricopeptide (TPR) repeat protein